jgi:hypothetical protein
VNTPEEIRRWAREQAAKLPPFTAEQARQLARSARAVDARLAGAGRRPEQLSERADVPGQR